ncbi:MAG: RNA polymerase subunit sigma-70 [Myxococcales bacterium]|nr:RNA polymerase subunit sigma-70 [Polyangiaceae bacterium]MDW8247832.1 RNA polymerase subunit sigma-70 [Myxococcales bacterium]
MMENKPRERSKSCQDTRGQPVDPLRTHHPGCNHIQGSWYADLYLATHRDLSDTDIFDEILHRRQRSEDPRALLGDLCERWRKPAGVVIRRIQASYRIEAPDDEPEIFQDAVQRLIEKGLDQYRGMSEQLPGKSASPKTFFLRIVKHLAIDRYRQKRELLDTSSCEEDESLYTTHEQAMAMEHSRQQDARKDAQELYWSAFQRLRNEHPNEATAWDIYHHQDVEDHNECARILSITVANSYKRISRAQAYLKRYLLELLEADDA